MAKSSKKQAQKHNSKPNPGLKKLDVLVGKWEMQASVGGQSLGSGRAEFKWLEGGAFLVLHEDAQPAKSLPAEMIAASPFPISAIIGLDESTEQFTIPKTHWVMVVIGSSTGISAATPHMKCRAAIVRLR